MKYGPRTPVDFAAEAEARKYGLDPDDPTAWLKVEEARDREKPCRECGAEGPRQYRLTCDKCVAALEAERRERTVRHHPEPVGRYQPDGFGCVEKVGSVERAYLNGWGPYG